MDLSVLFASCLMFWGGVSFHLEAKFDLMYLSNLVLVNIHPLLPILGLLSVVQIALLSGLMYCIAALFHVDTDLHCQRLDAIVLTCPNKPNKRSECFRIHINCSKHAQRECTQD